jgi:hypothetical protein
MENNVTLDETVTTLTANAAKEAFGMRPTQVIALPRI